MMQLSNNIKFLREQKGMTQKDLADVLGVTDKAVSTWESGRYQPRMGAIEKMAKYFNVEKGELLDVDLSIFQKNEPAREEKPIIPSNIHPVRKISYIPKLGRIACGSPITAEQNIEGYMLVPEGVKADFALDCRGDSMIDAGIDDGDVVFVRQQPNVENGEIAAVLIGDEATLKRVYLKGSTLTLNPANSDYQPLVYVREEIEEVKILGKATAVIKYLD